MKHCAIQHVTTRFITIMIFKQNIELRHALNDVIHEYINKNHQLLSVNNKVSKFSMEFFPQIELQDYNLKELVLPRVQTRNI